MCSALEPSKSSCPAKRQPCLDHNSGLDCCPKPMQGAVWRQGLCFSPQAAFSSPAASAGLYLLNCCFHTVPASVLTPGLTGSCTSGAALAPRHTPPRQVPAPLGPLTFSRDVIPAGLGWSPQFPVTAPAPAPRVNLLGTTAWEGWASAVTPATGQNSPPQAAD